VGLRHLEVQKGQMGDALCYFQDGPSDGGLIPPDGGLQLYFAPPGGNGHLLSKPSFIFSM
jgi:hypothetical protein